MSLILKKRYISMLINRKDTIFVQLAS
uniref:Uncharacterized protein n=1 Tax=Anguilla anguilla TaxID=7936 RepID=A0A0E9RLB2_ANGAN